MSLNDVNIHNSKLIGHDDDKTAGSYENYSNNIKQWDTHEECWGG